MRLRSTISMGALALLLGAPPVLGEVQAPRPETAEAAATLSAGDFAKLASIYSLYQVSAGQWAHDKAQRPDVKRFADHLVTEYKGNYDRLKRIHPEGMKSELNELHEKLLEQLKGAPDNGFDDIYVSQQVQFLRKELDVYTGFADGGEDEGLRAYAKKSLPAIQQDLDTARNLNAPSKHEGP